MQTRRQMLAVAAGAMGLALLGGAACGKPKKPLAGDETKYAGKWVASDGTFVHVFADGGGDFKMSSSNVTGGKAFIAGNKLTIGLGPIDKTFTIDEAPKETDGKWTMKLDGVEYTKE